MTDADTPAVWEVEGGDGEPTEEFVRCLATLLLSLDDDAEGQKREA